MPEPIPFNRPCLVGGELENIAAAMRSGHSSAKGPFTELVTMRLRDMHDAADVLLTTSCTDALEMSAMVLGLGPGDLVIVPSFTFSATATAFARQGAALRFCDIVQPSLGLDPAHVQASLTPDVKAIVTVHYAGVPSDVDALRRIADEHGIALIEDNAHGFFAAHRGTPLGTFGRMSTLSFHETKNFVCGEGGALVLNDERDVDTAHILLDKGTNRRQFLEGQVDKYTWQGHGSSFGMSDLLAAFLLAQLDASDHIRAQRRRVATTYRKRLTTMADEFDLQLPYEPADAAPADHMFYVMLPRQGMRAGVISSMREQGVNPTFHYVPLHNAPGAELLADRYQACPVTDDVSARLMRLPFYNDLSDGDIGRVVDVLHDALRHAAVHH
ncbi:MAG: dTDP-4-amino-4,6-dideoxygalactose transaminase [Ilumatobacteraceae bacterium]